MIKIFNQKLEHHWIFCKHSTIQWRRFIGQVPCSEEFTKWKETLQDMFSYAKTTLVKIFYIFWKIFIWEVNFALVCMYKISDGQISTSKMTYCPKFYDQLKFWCNNLWIFLTQIVLFLCWIINESVHVFWYTLWRPKNWREKSIYNGKFFTDGDHSFQIQGTT